MKKKVTCICENSFDVEVIEEINLDEDGKYLDEILNGTFLNFICPGCNKNLKPEFPISVLWPSKKLKFEVIPEMDRGEFYRRKKDDAKKENTKKEKPEMDSFSGETLIGYPELADRIALIRDGFEPMPVEAIKYHLQLKAEEQYPDTEMEIWYYGSAPDFLEFHIHGIKENEVAVMKVPMSVYNRTLNDFKEHPKAELYAAIRYRTYLSYKNTMRLETLK